ncbi:MAG: HAD family phosphatase [Clostridia bacterium]|nr:HAD family phosphatase [Clostridia bacterium]
MNKSLVFFDLDNTLLHRLDGKKSFVDEDINALHKLKEAGHEIFVNSGRSRSLMPDDLLDAVGFDGLICGSTYIEYHGEVIHHVIPDDDLIRRMCYFAHNEGWQVGLECEKEVYGIHGGIFHPAIDMSPSLDEFMKEPSKLLFTKFTFDRDVSSDVQEKFPEIKFINFGRFAEGIIAGYDKAFGMKLLGERLCVPRENLVAFGDSVNDYEMLRFAGVSVLMNNGPKEFDEFITLRTDKACGGVAEGIEKIFFS